MERTPRQRVVDAGILDRAAALLARHGVAKTSLQEVADAVGLSKAGLLHHYPSKDALLAAALDRARALSEGVLARVEQLPEGPDRDRTALEVLVDVALENPGLTALLLSEATRAVVPEDAHETTAPVLAAFGVDPTTTPLPRRVRVVGALSALGVLSLAARVEDAVTAWRPHVVATCLDALGPAAPPPPSPTPTRTAESET